MFVTRDLRVARNILFKGSNLLSRNNSFNTSTIRNFASVIPFKLADIGEGIAEVELMKWFVKEGDTVKSFDRICEVQSDKATVEITSRYDGKIAKVHYAEGAIVKVGEALIDIELPNSNATQSKLVNEKSDVTLPATSHYKPGSDSLSGASTFSREASVPANEKVQATPAVRKLAKERNIDLSEVTASGPKGRVTKEDILVYVQHGSVKISSAPQSHSPSKEKIEPEKKSTFIQPTPLHFAAQDQKVPIRGVQRLMVKSMTAALKVQHLTLCEEVSFDNLKTLRSTLKSQFSDRGVKISYMPLLIKITSLALNQFPQLNATVNDDVTEMIYHANHNIGVAMDTEKGLVVPIIKSVQNKSIFAIAQELNQLQAAAKNNALTEAQLTGGTFSLSNIGSVGGTYAVPVVVVPQVAIGALGRLQVVPRYVDKHGRSASIDDIEDGKAVVTPRTIMNISWSADHRVVDGATVAKFSNLWASYVENPQLMFTDLR